MKKISILIVALATAIISAGLLFGLSDAKVIAAADKDIPISLIVNGDEYVYKNYKTRIEYGELTKKGELYKNGVLQNEHTYILKYAPAGSTSLSENINSFYKVGMFDIHLSLNGIADNGVIGNVKVVAGNIANVKLEPSMSTVNPFRKEYYSPTVRASNSYGNLSLAGCKFIKSSTTNPDNFYPGTATVTVDTSESELFYGTASVNYQVEAVDLKSGLYELTDISSRTYNGELQTFSEPRLRQEQNSSMWGPNDLFYMYLTDDEVTYSNNIDAGTASITISGRRFKGSLTVTFEIKELDVYNINSYEVAHYQYTGSPVEPQTSLLKVYDDLYAIRDIDYEIIGYKYNTAAGRAYMTIRGIGNYKGEKDIIFYIDPLSIKDANITVPGMTFLDYGAIIERMTKVTLNGKELVKDTDYTIKFSDNKVKITGNRNYCDSTTLTVNNALIDLSKAELKLPEGYNYTYSYKENKPLIELNIPTDTGIKSIRETYTNFNDWVSVEYSNNINAGTATIKVSAKDKTKFCNSKTFTFKINPIDASELTVEAPDTYAGPDTSPKVTHEDHVLQKGKDFDLKVDNTGLGKVNATLTFKGNYKGTRKISYELSADLKNAKIDNITLCENKPATVTFVLYGLPLTEGKDYKVTKSDIFETNKDNLKINLEGISDYCKGTKSFQYDLKDTFSEVGHYDQLVAPDQVYMSGMIEPYFNNNGKKVTLNDMREGCYFPIVTYLDNISPSKGQLSLKFDVIDFTVTMIKSFNISTASLKNAKISAIAPVVYTGKAQTPAIKVTIGKSELKKDVDYKVEYKNNINIGTAKVIVTGIGQCRDSIETTFEIVKKLTPTPTTKPAPTGAVSNDEAVAKISEFVKRIYIYVLDREPEAEGAAFWTDELYAFRRTGAEVGLQFIFSPEFESRGTTDEQFVTILYKTFFGRDPEADGFAFWLSQLSTGTMDRFTVASGFVYSQEWADTCASYGIRSGGDLKPTGSIAPTALTYAFVERMYTTAMGRGYDEEGRQYWASQLANFEITGEVCGASFFLSDEMNGYGLSDKEFLSRLYATFMNREPDADGENYWLGLMASGAPRADIVFGFTRSPEFTDKCIEARILPF